MLIEDYADNRQIAVSAELAALLLRDERVAYVEIEPGDMTVYRVLVFRVEPGLFYVANNFAPLYPWHGDPVHPDYATEKWGGERFNRCTGAVMAEFLTQLSEHLGRG